MKTLTLLLLISLLFVAYYDFRYMAVPLLLLICTVIISFLRLILLNNYKQGLLFAGVNITGCLVIVLLSFLVMFIVRLKVFNPLNVLLGTGDLVFFPAICFSFSPVNFVLFFISSLAAMLVIKPILFRSKPNFPLAGGISIIMFIAILAGMIVPFSLYNDTYILNLLYH
jgi:hypothetical protein